MADQTSTRIDFIDALRGFALFGILQVNIPYQGASSCWIPGLTSGVNGWVEFFVQALFSLKFFTIFSFLFGYGFAVLLARAEAADKPATVPYLRRLLALAAFGIAHAVLLFVGDILLSYALLGLVLLVSRNLSDRMLLTIGGASLLLGAMLIGLLSIEIAANGVGSPDAICRAGDAAMRTGSFIEVARMRQEWLPFVLGFVASLQWPAVIAAFLAGAVAARRGVFRDGWRAPVLPAWSWAAAIVGVLVLVGGQALIDVGWWKPGEGVAFTTGFFSALAAPVLSALYCLGLWRLRGSTLLRALIPAGRASLSNYLGQGLVTSLLFCGYGFGLFGSISALGLAGIALAVPAGLGLATYLWLTVFRQGPAEWLLRRLTHGAGSPHA